MARIAGDKLAVKSSGVNVQMLQPLGLLPGLQITLVGGLNGVGRGLLRYDGSGNLGWRAPRSSQRGADVDVSAGGDFVLYDGGDLDKWIALNVTAASLAASYQSVAVNLSEKFLNAIASQDFAVGAGATEWYVTLSNESGEQLTGITAWLAADIPQNRELRLRWGLFGGWATSFNEADGLTAFGSRTLNAGTSEKLYIERTIDDLPHPGRRIVIWIGFDDGEAGRAYLIACGRYRVYDEAAALYEAYQDDTDDPVPGIDSPLDTSPSVPWTPTDAFGDATHRLALVAVNRYGLRGGATRIVRKRISGGQETGLEPNEPAAARLVALPEGYTRLLARYLRPRDAEQQATHWAVWYTTDGSTPGSGDPDYSTPIRWGRGRCGILDWRGIPQQADGVVVKVLVKTKLDTLYCPIGRLVNYTVDRTGPDAPQGGRLVP